MHGTHTRSQNHSFSGLLTGIRGAEEKKPGVERISMPLRETWESDGNQGWKDGVPGSQAPRESRKEEGNTGNKKALPGTRMGSAGRTGRRNKRFGDKKWGSRSRMLDGNPQRLKRRRATLPHPLECSTIAAPGLSYRVRNGTGRLTRAMTTANLTATARKPKESKPACHRWRFGNRLADARQTPIVVSFSDHPNAYCRPGRSSTGKTRNQPPCGWNVVSPSPVSTGRLHPSRGFHLRPIKHVFNMRATTVQDRTES